VTSNVTAEEVQALAGDGAPPPRTPAVEVRDFREPRRLTAPQLAKHARSVARALVEIEGSLAIWLRGAYRCEVESVREASAVEVLRDLGSDRLLAAFDCAGRRAWAVWDAKIAAAGTEIALGATEVKEPKARVFSNVERGVLKNMLGRVIAHVAQTLEVDTKNVRVVQDEIQMELERTDAREGDPQRLAVYLQIAGPIGESVLRLYLAGVKAPDAGPAPAKDAKDKKKPPPAPEHLLDVPLDLSAQLGTTEIALSDLLGLEVGDVIPLSVASGSALTVYVDGIPCGTARFGEHKGRLAIQLQTFGARDVDPQT
jgi:flagellar motor switch protein FliM